ncbi:MAG: hypothetical protein H6702_22340 [Myxococcales bacterium]|nr:hypothetical protein [Myxococcales bacterium]
MSALTDLRAAILQDLRDVLADPAPSEAAWLLDLAASAAQVSDIAPDAPELVEARFILARNASQALAGWYQAAATETVAAALMETLASDTPSRFEVFDRLQDVEHLLAAAQGLGRAALADGLLDDALAAIHRYPMTVGILGALPVDVLREAQPSGQRRLLWDAVHAASDGAAELLRGAAATPSDDTPPDWLSAFLDAQPGLELVHVEPYRILHAAKAGGGGAALRGAANSGPALIPGEPLGLWRSRDLRAEIVREVTADDREVLLVISEPPYPDEQIQVHAGPVVRADGSEPGALRLLICGGGTVELTVGDEQLRIVV